MLQKTTFALPTVAVTHLYIPDEWLDAIGEEYQTREKRFDDMTFEQYYAYRIQEIAAPCAS